MRRIIHSAQSRLDLLNIWLHVANENADAADHLIGEIKEKLVKLADFPGIGQRRDDFGKSLRSFPVGKYVIFYRAETNGIGVARIVHGARDLRRLFPRHPKK